MKTKKNYEFTTNFLRKTILKIVIHEQKFVIHFFMKKHIDFLAFFLKKRILCGLKSALPTCYSELCMTKFLILLSHNLYDIFRIFIMAPEYNSKHFAKLRSFLPTEIHTSPQSNTSTPAWKIPAHHRSAIRQLPLVYLH